MADPFAPAELDPLGQARALRARPQPQAPSPTGTGIGYSPDRLQDEENRLGGTDAMMGKVLSARYHEAGADPSLTALAPVDRAALDRYANFALVGREAPAWRAPIDYAGGMLAMGGTEAMKLARPVQSAVSSVYNRVTGNPGGTSFFGGQDTSPPSLSNITSAHYGFMHGRDQAAALRR